MKSRLIILFVLLLPLFIKAQVQPTNLDSMQKVLKTAPNDSVKMVALFNLAGYYPESNQDSCLYYADQGIITAKKINQPLWVAHFLTEFQSYIAMVRLNLPLSFKLANDALALTQDEKNEKDVYIPRDYEFQDPHKFRLSQMGYTIHQLGNIYNRAGNIETAIEYYKKEINIFKSLGSKTAMALVQGNMNIGTMYQEKNILDSAMIYSQKALDYANNSSWKMYNGIIYATIGNIFKTRDMLDSARYYYLKSLSEAHQQHSTHIEMNTAIFLAQLYKEMQQADSTKYYAMLALHLSNNFNYRASVATAATFVSDALEMQGNTDSAFFYLSLSRRIGDSINTDQYKKMEQFQKINFEEQLRLEKNAQEAEARSNKIRTTGLIVGLILLSAIAFLFYRNNRRNQKAKTVLLQQKQTIETTLSELQATQSQLIQSEKMASLGELTAGIAHEIQNPLNFVNNFSEVNKEIIDEASEEMSKGNYDEVKSILNDIKENSEKINHHGKRADAIVKGMLQHSRASTGKKEPTDINALCDEYLRLAYHGLRAKDKAFNAKYETNFDTALPKINIVPQDMGRVVLNLLTNAFYAVNEKNKSTTLSGNNEYEPTVTIATQKVKNKIVIEVADNGSGITDEVKQKIFQPFFTTKPTGKGTGLGLSMSYEIVTNGHAGAIEVESKPGEGTIFKIILPL